MDDGKGATINMPSSPLSKSETVALSVAFSVTAFTIIVGNSLTIAAFTKTKLLRRPTHYFLISLAVADLMVGAVAMPLYISHFINPALWSGSQVLQASYYTVDIVSGLASVFTLAVVSLERLYAVGWPWKYRHSSSLKLYIISVAGTWLLAMSISCLYLAFRFSLVSNVVHFISVTLLSISVVITCASYSGLWFRIKRRRKRCKRAEKDKRLATTLCVVTGFFILTWTPFQILIIIVHFCKGCRIPPYRLVYVIKLLQYSNSLVNMLVYSLRMPEFRKAITSFVKTGSFSPKRAPRDRNLVEIPLTSVSNLESLSPVVKHRSKSAGYRRQCDRKYRTKGKRTLAITRDDLFSIR